MALDRVPWFIGGKDEQQGPAHSAEVARLQSFVGSDGFEGIITPSDFRVLPLTVPAGKVRVMPGACSIRQRYGGLARQSYMARGGTQTEVSINPTGSGGGRTDLLVVRILDPQYEGTWPADVNDFDYVRFEVIEGVPAGTRLFSELGLNYPALALARIDLPANTGTVTAAHITDVRQIMRLSTWPDSKYFALDTGDEDRLDTTVAAGGEVWPNSAVLAWDPGVWVPEWATRMKIRMIWSGINFPAGAVSGEAWVQIGGFGNDPETVTQKTRMKAPPGAQEKVHIVQDDRAVHEGHRGRYRRFFPMAGLNGSVPTNQRPWLHDGSSVSLDITFYNPPD